MILTRVDMAVELKLPLLPNLLPSELPIETGLLTLFQALQTGEAGEAVPLSLGSQF